MDAASTSSESPSSTLVGLYGEMDSLAPPRPDGKAQATTQIIAGSVSSADGSALVKFGETTVLCGIRAEIAEPDILAPNSGFLGEDGHPHFAFSFHAMLQCVAERLLPGALPPNSPERRPTRIVLLQVPSRPTKR